MLPTQNRNISWMDSHQKVDYFRSLNLRPCTVTRIQITLMTLHRKKDRCHESLLVRNRVTVLVLGKEASGVCGGESATVPQVQ